MCEHAADTAAKTRQAARLEATLNYHHSTALCKTSHVIEG